MGRSSRFGGDVTVRVVRAKRKPGNSTWRVHNRASAYLCTVHVLPTYANRVTFSIHIAYRISAIPTFLPATGFSRIRPTLGPDSSRGFPLYSAARDFAKTDLLRRRTPKSAITEFFLNVDYVKRRVRRYRKFFWNKSRRITVAHACRLSLSYIYIHTQKTC